MNHDPSFPNSQSHDSRPGPSGHEDLVEISPEATQASTKSQTSRRGPSLRKRRVGLPIGLFIATCLSTFWVGMTRWEPLHVLSWLFAPAGFAPRGYDPLLSDPAIEMRRDLLAYAENWQWGLLYMASLLAILFAHEMGHFLMTLRYRIPASFPFFIPLPITPIGTMGAVIGMDGLRANRKELFDIGLAGPLAGLVIAFPVLYLGILQMDLTQQPTGDFKMDMPLIMVAMMSWMEVPGYEWGVYVNQSQLNPYFMAGWVGLLVTGLNMIPVSQLDGGHVTYTMFGRFSHWIARGFILGGILFAMFVEGGSIWIPMLILVVIMGPSHPPTSDDNVPIGWFRYTLGGLSLLIPILCFPPFALMPVTMP